MKTAQKIIRNNICPIVQMAIMALLTFAGIIFMVILIPVDYLCNDVGSPFLAVLICFVIPGVLILCSLINLFAKTTREVKYWLYGLPVQIIIYALYGAFYYQHGSLGLGIVFILGTFFVQAAGILVRRYKDKKQCKTNHSAE